MPTGKSNEESAWTVLVYLAGDNNLTEDMIWGLQELKKTSAQLESAVGKGGEGISVVAHFDPRGSRGRRYDFVPRSRINTSRLNAAEDGNLDLFEALVSTPAVVAAQAHQLRQSALAESSLLATQLAAFVREQVRKIPHARQYFLVFSGHGSGAVGDFLTDLDPTTSLSIPELAIILSEARKAYEERFKESEPNAKGAPKRIAVLGMDSCLMSNAEVCYEISDHADFLVASEGFVANAGWPYHRVLEAFVPTRSNVADTDPQAVARNVADKYSLFYRDYEISGLSTDIAVCNLEAFRAHDETSFVARLRDFARLCVRSFDDVFVEDVVREMKVGAKAARALRQKLAEEIEYLLRAGKTDAKGLSAELRDGSQGSLKALQKPPKLDALNASQYQAVRELVEAKLDRFDPDDEGFLRSSIKKHWRSLLRELTRSSSRHLALAAVKVRREFDPGVLRALALIEKQEALGRPEAKKARSLLQKLHQVQSVLELKQLTVGLRENKNDQLLVNALVAARWQAQSFKGGVYVDLFDLCLCLEERLRNGTASAVCRHVRDSIERPDDGAVLLSRYTGGAFQHAHGLSVYFPSQAGDYLPEYENLEFAKRTGWGRFVRSYLRATRRERRDEARHWANADDRVLRFGDREVDPLETDGIETKIVGVATSHPRAGTTTKTDHREGTERKVREGTERKVREGTERKVREGTERKIKGEGVVASWGNPPDGFYRQ